MKEENLKDRDSLEIYELGYHLLPSISEEDVPKEVAAIHSLLSENEGSIIAEAAPILRQLAYPLGKKVETKTLRFNKAYFGWIKFEIEKSKIEVIDKQVKSNQNILRFILVKTVRENTMFVPKAPLFKKESHSEDRPAKIIEESEKTESSEADIDKSIDELIIS